MADDDIYSKKGQSHGGAARSKKDSRLPDVQLNAIFEEVLFKLKGTTDPSTKQSIAQVFMDPVTEEVAPGYVRVMSRNQRK